VTGDERGLLEAVIAAPDDDAPRMVYADWLQGRGDPRGEFIQLQCRLAAAPDDDQRRALRIAENKLLAAHEAGWTKPLLAALPPAANPDHYAFELSRGFFERARVPLAAVPNVPELLALAPTIRRLEIVPGLGIVDRLPQPRLDGVLAAPWVERLLELEVGLGGGANELAHELAGMKTLANLRRLRVHGSVWGEMASWFDVPPARLVLDDEGALALARSPYLANLELLDLARNRLTGAGLAAIAGGRWRLKELALADNVIELGQVPIAQVFGAPALAGLEVLDLAGVTATPKDVKLFVGGPHLANLRELDLERSHLGKEGAAALCDAFALPSLRRLRLERNSLCDAGALAIAGCARLAKLTTLEAGHNLIGKKGGTALATSAHLAGLERLTLNEPRWKPEMRDVFATSPTLANAKIYLAGRLVGRAKAKKSKSPRRE